MKQRIFMSFCFLCSFIISGFFQSNNPNYFETNIRKSKTIAQQNNDFANANNSYLDLFKAKAKSSKAIENGDETYYVYTPKGTPVEVMKLEEFEPDEIESSNQGCAEQFPNAIRVGTSTRKYNCHSFAWYSQSLDNCYWMNDPSSYYTDGSYELSNGQINDIVCYYTLDNTLIHSGIVIDRIDDESNGVCQDANLITVKSKWGGHGLYIHRGDESPYTYPMGDAVYLKYYKLHTTHKLGSYINDGEQHYRKCTKCDYKEYGEHSFNSHCCIYCYKTITPCTYVNSYIWFNYNFHYSVCTCKQKIKQGHAISADSISNGTKYAKCLFCGGNANIGIIKPTSTLSCKRTKNGSYILNDSIVVLVRDDIVDYINNCLIFY